ncbi:hypothetical protein [Brevibacillus migulae]|uniref:hypothetical protein n=1 Tax=Brevibacillus migulae TaxID=1644114 RepID=UPI00106E74A5|nr:hypothetical protein [Brevibacillus migulae]
MKRKRKVKSVTFSQADPFECQLLKHANRQGRFATYVKRLIQRDMEKNNAPAEASAGRTIPSQGIRVVVGSKEFHQGSKSDQTSTSSD